VEDGKKVDVMDELINYSAFENMSSVSTSFSKSLEKSILELAQEHKDIYMTDIFNKFGNYKNVQHQIKRMILENKILIYETIPNSINNNDFESQKVELVDTTISRWVDLAAQPCLTCSIVTECKIDNPISPATCQEFEQWLDLELELDASI
jgi:hypothetical protein